MDRKYIYIIVIVLTITLVVYNHYIGLSADKTAVELDEIIELDETQKNTEIKYNLTINNTQNDEKNLVYSYKITIPSISGAYKYTKGTEESYLIFTANGEAEITLNSNDTLVIYDLPEGTTYKVEQTTDVSDKYTTKVGEENTTTIEGTINETSTIEFKNETIIQDEPVKKNPFTSDNHYLVLFVSIYAIILVIIGLKLKIKRFD